MSNINLNANTFVTPTGVLAFRQLAEPNDDGKYSANVVFPIKTAEQKAAVAGMIAFMKAKAEAAFGPNAARKVRGPIRDGIEKEHLSGFGAGTIFINPSSKWQPKIFDRGLAITLDKETIDETFYSGCFVRLIVGTFHYGGDGRKDANGAAIGKGLSFSLQGIEKVAEGERLHPGMDEASALALLEAAGPGIIPVLEAQAPTLDKPKPASVAAPVPKEETDFSGLPIGEGDVPEGNQSLEQLLGDL